jgi:hypothetical protein
MSATAIAKTNMRAFPIATYRGMRFWRWRTAAPGCAVHEPRAVDQSHATAVLTPSVHEAGEV